MLATPRQMLVYLIFSASAANGIYQLQGIDSIDECEYFDKDDAVSFLRSVRKLSGGRNGWDRQFLSGAPSQACRVLHLSQDPHQQDSGLWGYHCSCDLRSE